MGPTASKTEPGSIRGGTGDHPRIAVVILNYNGSDHLRTFLPSVIQHSNDSAEIIVADNGSTDDSIKILEDHFPEVTIKRIKENHGFAGGYNIALEDLPHEYYVLLNSDVEVTRNWLDPLINMLDIHPDIAAVQPKILSWKEKRSFEHAGACGGYLDSMAYAFCRGRVMDTVERDEGQYDHPAKTCWATGAAMVIRGDLFRKIGGFDARYFAHFEEIDLCWRLRRTGRSIAVQPKSVVYHLGGGTLSYHAPGKLKLNFRNSLYTLFKNEPAYKLLLKFPFRLILDGVAGLQFLFKGETTGFRCILKAHMEFYRDFGHSIRRKRLESRLIKALEIKHRDKAHVVYGGLIIVQYFLLGKKKFHQIMQTDEIRLENTV